MARALAGQHNADCSAGRTNARRDDPGICDDRGKQLRRSRGDRRGSRYQGAGSVAESSSASSADHGFGCAKATGPSNCVPTVNSPIFVPMSFPTSVEKR